MEEMIFSNGVSIGRPLSTETEARGVRYECGCVEFLASGSKSIFFFKKTCSEHGKQIRALIDREDPE